MQTNGEGLVLLPNINDLYNLFWALHVPAVITIYCPKWIVYQLLICVIKAYSQIDPLNSYVGLPLLGLNAQSTAFKWTVGLHSKIENLTGLLHVGLHSTYKSIDCT